MRRLLIVPALIALIVIQGVGLKAATTHAQAGALQVYTTTVDQAELEQLLREERDIGSLRLAKGGYQLHLVLSPHEQAELRARGLDVQLWRSPEGKTSDEMFRIQQDEGYDVYRSYDEEGGIHDELYEIHENHADITDLQVIGTTHQGREIIAMKVTKDAQTTEDGSRPVVLYSALQHAREWIAIEVNRRLLRHFTEQYGEDPEITALVDANEYWFVVVANPDGYQYTFEGQRLWRKNMRDNDEDGEITNVDGVDPNRNFDAHWNYDINGSSGSFSSSTYRGPEVASEPMTQAMQDLIARIKPRLQLNYHSAAHLLLYPNGWQDQTPSVDHAIFKALAGTRENPAVEGFDPILSAGLYITNGETCDFAYEKHGVLCYTPELSTPPPGSGGSGFEFPDDEDLIQEEFERNLDFALDIARTVEDPTEPSSHLGNTVEPMYASEFSISYGSPQTVEVTAQRKLGDVTLKWSINDGPARSAATEPWEGGERYGVAGSVYYHRVRGQVTGAQPGDEVRVWFEAGGETTEPFTYRQEAVTRKHVLVLSAEDYTGIEPPYEKTDGPSYLQAYLDALAANEIPADVYDIDAHDRVPPSALGVLNHYAVVIWYTGDDVNPRTAEDVSQEERARLANETQLQVRDFLNEGGRLLWSGKYAGFPYTPASGNGLQNDFLQYYMGAYDQGLAGDTPIDIPNQAGEGIGWWSGSSSNLNVSVTRELDLRAATGEIVFSFGSQWDMERDFDYGYVELSGDGGQTWETLQDMDGQLTDSNPNGPNRGWGLTGSGQERLRFDLSARAGMTATLRMVYDSDQGTNLSGWQIDDLALADDSGTLYENDLEGDVSDWTVQGWLTVPIRERPDERMPRLAGVNIPFEGLKIDLGPPGADNQDNYMLYNPTSQVMPPDTYPQFDSWAGGEFDVPGNKPHTGDYYLWSGETVYAYQQVTRTVDLSDETEGSLHFWASRQAREPWDVLFVEARAVGSEDWTTLPDRNGHTSPQAGLNCTTGSWYERFARLANYMSVDEQGACQPTGATGEWNAGTGYSDGWEEWSIDLSAYAGGEVEISISYVSSRLAFPGIFLDDVELSTGEATSFEEDLGGWTVTGQDRVDTGEAHEDDFRRATGADYPSQNTPIVVTEDTILLGFGIEGISSTEVRDDVVGRAYEYLTRDISFDPPAIYLPAAYREGGGG